MALHYQYQPHNQVVGFTLQDTHQEIKDTILKQLPKQEQLDQFSILDIGILMNQDTTESHWALKLRPAATIKFDPEVKPRKDGNVRIDLCKRHSVTKQKYLVDCDYFDRNAVNYDEIKNEIAATLTSAVVYAIEQIKLMLGETQNESTISET